MSRFLRTRPFPLHPLLFGIYPVLALLAHNIAEIPAGDGLRALLSTLILAVLILSGLSLLLRDVYKVALVTSLIVLLFFSYGHLLSLLKNASLAGSPLGRHRFLVPVYLIGWLLATWAVLRTRHDLSALTRLLNVIASVLVFIPLLQIGIYEGRSLAAERSEQKTAVAAPQLQVKISQDAPDVYYILLDGYPRADFIADHLGQDIDPFLSSLQERGFYVPRCSQSNYSDTRFSMAATLNMNYLDKGTGEPEVLVRADELDELIQSSAVQKNFEDLGYQIVTFEPGFRWLNWRHPDYHLKHADENTARGLAVFGLNGFEYMLLNTSAGKLFLDGRAVLRSNLAADLDEFIENPRYHHWRDVEFALETLPKTSTDIPGPKLVYAHIISPHPPFVFNAQGEPLANNPPDELAAYGEQIVYLNRRILEVVDQILAHSEQPPVIIIQGDHGATIDYAGAGIDATLRLGILNAYYLPGVEPGKIYPTISPVNTFRLIFNVYFNGGYELLEDKSIFGRQSPFVHLDCETGEPN
jgi:hypothetical protein